MTALAIPAPTLRDAPAIPERRGILQVVYGKHAFKKFVLEPGQKLTFGRNDKADVAIDDAEMSGLHFQVWFSGGSAIVRDMESHAGTLINGGFAARGRVGHGGFVVAGQTTFQLFLEGLTPPVDDPPGPERLAQLEAAKVALGPVDGSLYGVMDAARDDRVLWLLQESVDDHQNLYEGLEGRTLDPVAPYLVRFRPGSTLLSRLLLGGWGHAWGIYFRSSRSPKDVRRHLRRYLMVQDEETLERLYFRYYDPRVLREYLPVATTRQRGELLSAFDEVVLEGEAGEVLTFAEPAQAEEEP